MLRIERIVARHAAGALPMPNNPQLGELAGGLKRQSAARALDRLAEIGRIQIERRGDRRRVHLLDTVQAGRSGDVTGWGQARPGHAPYSSFPRGVERPQGRERRPQSRPMPTRAPDPPPAALPGDMPAPLLRLQSVRPATTCQWPMWPDGVRPDNRYCGAPCRPGRSWCAEHVKRVFEPPRGATQNMGSARIVNTL